MSQSQINKSMMLRSIVFIFISMLAYPVKAQIINVNYYSQIVNLPLIQVKSLDIPKKPNNQNLKELFSSIGNRDDFEKLRVEIDTLRRKLDLCDWLIFKLVEKYVNTYEKFSETQKRIFIWCILNNLGFDLRTTLDKQASLFILTEREITGDVNLLNIGGKIYIQLTKNPARELEYSMPCNMPNKAKYFNLSNIKPPKLKNCVLELRSVVINTPKANLKIEFSVNKTIVDIYKEYPQLDYKYFFNVKLSEECQSTLVPQLCKSLISEDTLASLRRLLEFVKSSSEYKDDMEVYGKEKPMSPEEALFYRFSDCEDRTALFYYLVKQLYKIDILVLGYRNHVNVALLIKSKNFKDVFLYNKQNYVVCEPTEIVKKTELGQSLAFESNRNPKIISISYFNFLDVYKCK